MPGLRRWAAATGLALTTSACGGTPTLPPPPGRMALTGVTLIDGTGAAPVVGRTILLDGGRIVAIAADGGASLAADTEVLDLEGRWVMPGLVDTHVHMPDVDDQPRFLGNLLGFGVTTARSTAAAPSGGTELRSRIADGAVAAPRFLTAGRLIDGPGSVWGSFGSVVETEADIRAEIRAQAAQRVDFVKLYAGLGPELVRAGIDEAHARGLPVLGHLGRTTWTEAVGAGIDGLTHGCFWGMASSVVPRADSARFAELYLPNTTGAFSPGLLSAWAEALDLTDPRFVAMARDMGSRRVSWDPNMVLCEATVFGNRTETRDRLLTEYDVQAPPFPHPYSRNWAPASLAVAQSAFPALLTVVKALYDHGVLLTLGTDTMNPWMTPGAAALRELELFVQAGLTPLEAITVATRNGAEALGVLDETGTIAVGKAADLLVLGADPTTDISNVRVLEFVFRGGRVYEAGDLRRR